MSNQELGYRRIVINAVVLAILSFVMLVPAVVAAGAMNNAPPFVGLKLASDSQGQDSCLRFDQASFAYSITTGFDCLGSPIIGGRYKILTDEPNTIVLTGEGLGSAKYKFEYSSEKGRVVFIPSVEPNEERKVCSREVIHLVSS